MTIAFAKIDTHELADLGWSTSRDDKLKAQFSTHTAGRKPKSLHSSSKVTSYLSEQQIRCECGPSPGSSRGTDEERGPRGCSNLTDTHKADSTELSGLWMLLAIKAALRHMWSDPSLHLQMHLFKKKKKTLWGCLGGSVG